MEESTLKVLTVIGTWVASIGTVGAVITALYLARRESKLNLHVGAGHRIIVGTDIKKPPDYCSIYIVNKGSGRQQLQILVGVLACSKSVMPYSKLIVMRIQALCPWNSRLCHNNKNTLGEHHWIDEFPKGFISKHPKWLVRTLRLQVFTSVGRTFEAKVEKNLAEKLVESAERHLTKRSSKDAQKVRAA